MEHREERHFTVGDRLTTLARELRRKSTLAEAILWKELRSRKFAGVKFRRQRPIHGYIVDFVSLEKRLIIELDGGQHAESGEEDLERDSVLQRSGFTVLRFRNNEVLENLDGVLEIIRVACLKARSGSSSGS